MSAATTPGPISAWHPTAAEVNAMVCELRPLIRSFAERDRRWLDAVVRDSAPDGPGPVGRPVAA